MRRTLSLLTFLLATPAFAHGPTPIKVDETIVIAADTKAVWLWPASSMGSPRGIRMYSR